MSFIYNQAAATQSKLGLSTVAAVLMLVVVMVAIFQHAGPAADVMGIVGP